MPTQSVAITPAAPAISAYERPWASVATKSATTAGDTISPTGWANRSESVNTSAATAAAAHNPAAAAAQLR